jgi:hypothetical protein
MWNNALLARGRGPVWQRLQTLAKTAASFCFILILESGASGHSSARDKTTSKDAKPAAMCNGS